MRHLIALALFVLIGATAIAQVTAPTYLDATGRRQQSQGFVPLDTSGNLLSPVGTDTRGSGTLDASSTSSVITIPLNNHGTLGLRFSGLAATGATVGFYASNDGGSNYTTINSFNAGTGVASQTYVVDGSTRLDVGGRTNIQVRIQIAGTAGTVSVAYVASNAEALIANTSPLVPGTNFVGLVGQGASALATAAVAPTVNRGATSLVGKASAGNLFGYAFTQGATAGFFALVDATAAPTAGAAITPIECVPVAANSFVRMRQPVADRYATGIVVLSTSSCTTFTAVTPLVISVSVQ